MGGTLSYMNDSVTMIFYTTYNEATENFHTLPKHTRQVFCYNEGLLLQSRLYPCSDNNETRQIYRNLVQKALADCLDLPNLWTVESDREDVGKICITGNGALHYPDYEHNFNASVSKLKDFIIGEEIYIGTEAYCIECGCNLYDNDSLHCGDCGDSGIYCKGCDDRIDEDDAIYIDGDGYFCNNCVSYCDSCNHYIRGEMYEVTNSRGYSHDVCEDCLCDFNYCEHCDTHQHEDNGNYIDDKFVCDDCQERHFAPCAECGEIVNIDDLESVNYDNYCESCAETKREEMEEEDDMAKIA